MASKLGPFIITNGLVFGFDVGDVKNSYIGEPTTNLVTYSQNMSSGWTGNLFNNWINATVTTNTDLAPDGTFTANKLTGGYSRFTDTISVVANTTYIASVWLKNINLGVDPQLIIATGLNGSLVSYATASTVSRSSIVNWTRVSLSITIPASGVNQIQFGVAYSNDYPNQNSILVWGAQFELKSHITQYLPTNGTYATRSNTQGLLNLANINQPINLSNATFDNSANITFNGNTSYLRVADNVLASGSQYTLLAFLKPNTSNWGDNSMPMYNTYDNGYGFWHHFSLGNSLGVRHYPSGSAGATVDLAGIGLVANTWQMTAITWDGSIIRLYKNGILQNSASFTTSYTVTSGGRIGMLNARSSSADYNWNGWIDIEMLYNRALTSVELTQIFNSIRNRYNI